MKDNTRFYRMIRLLRLQMKNSNPNPRTHLALETLAEATISFQDPKVDHGVDDNPNLVRVQEVPEG